MRGLRTGGVQLSSARTVFGLRTYTVANIAVGAAILTTVFVLWTMFLDSYWLELAELIHPSSEFDAYIVMSALAAAYVITIALLVFGCVNAERMRESGKRSGLRVSGSCPDCGENRWSRDGKSLTCLGCGNIEATA